MLYFLAFCICATLIEFIENQALFDFFSPQYDDNLLLFPIKISMKSKFTYCVIEPMTPLYHGDVVIGNTKSH